MQPSIKITATKIGTSITFLLFIFSCDSNLKIRTTSAPIDLAEVSQEVQGGDNQTPTKLTQKECIDPDLSHISPQATLTLCDGSTATGQMNLLPCSSSGQVGCITTASVSAVNPIDISSDDIRAGIVIAGVMGTAIVESHGDCITDGAMGCVATAFFRAADASNVISGNIRAGVTIAGVAGSVTLESHHNCSSDGEIDCVATAAYRAVDMSQVVAGHIKNGVIIAGMLGTYPSFVTPLAGASGTNDLTSLTAATAAGSYEFFDSTGARHTGSIADAGAIVPGASDLIFNTSLYRQFSVMGDPNLMGNNIEAGVEIFGVSGTLTPSPADCTNDAEVGCVTTNTFKAADLSNLTPDNIKKNVVIASVTGDYPSSLHPLAGSDITNDLTAFAATSGGATYEWFMSDGTRVTGTIESDETITAGANDVVLNVGLYRSVTVSGDADLIASNIKDSVTLFGVTGNVVPSAANCSNDGEIGCVTTALYKAAHMANVIPSNIKDTIMIAGVTGNLSGAPVNCSSNGQMGCVTTSTYKSADLTNLLSANVKNGITIAGTLGTYPSVATPLTGATGTADLTSLAATTPAGSYEFFDSIGARYVGAISDAGTITPGVSNQSFSASLYRQFTVTGDADLTAGNIRVGTNIFGITGTVTPSPSNCNTDNQVGCVTTAIYKSADTGSFLASDIKSGKTIAGVSGTLANCSMDGGMGCVTTASYRAANMSDVSAANIKSGVTIAGQLGEYPSSSYPLTGADGTADLDLATFNAKMKSASSFQWFSSTGARYLHAGDTDIIAANIKDGVLVFGTTGTMLPAIAPDPWDVRVGTVVNGVTGQLQVNCRNFVGSYNNTTSPAVSGTDIWDNIDDYNNGNAYPTTNPWGSAQYACNKTNTWQDVTADGSCNSSGDECMFKDKISGLIWSEEQTSTTWTSAVTYCDNLTFGGYSDWRLPTQKEFQAASVHGFYSLKGTYFSTSMNGNTWTGSTMSDNTGQGWYIQIHYGGFVESQTKSTSARVFCVRP